jgi:hypothetical protein
MPTASKKRMREPASLEDYQKKTGIDELLMLSRLGYPPTLKPVEAVHLLDREFVRGTDGAGKHVFLPQTRMQSIGEFIKGALHIIAPKARVTILATPYAGMLASFPEDVEPNLKANIEKSIRPDDKEFCIIDAIDAGTTARAIAKHLPSKPKEIAVGGFNARHDGLARYGLFEDGSFTDKLTDGRFAAGRGYVLGFLLKHRKTDPHVIGRFRANAEMAMYSLWDNPETYFTEDELKGSVFRTWSPRDKYAVKEPVLEFVEKLPKNRQQQIINQLNKEDAREAKALYLLGVAAAKDYLSRKR